MNSKELIEYWINSSDKDYNVLEHLYEKEDYTWVLFLGHLVIEKLFKALYAKVNKDNPYAPKIHNLLKLAERL